MKICIPLRDPATHDLRLGNLRSEGRWERQALEACTRNPLIEEIYTLGYSWADGGIVSPKYQGILRPPAGSDVILLAQDWNTNTARAHSWKSMIVNIFSGPWIEQLEEIKELVSLYGNRLIFTMGFSAIYNAETTRSHLEKFLDKENVVLLPVPGIPEVINQDSFDNKTLLWASRIIFVSQLGAATPIQWALNRLRDDPSLSLCMLTGSAQWELMDLINGEVIRGLKDDINDLFWSIDTVKSFTDVRPRVRVELGMSWVDVLQRYSRAKLMIAYCKQFGGPPLEASMHGVPFIATSKTGALADCPNYLYASDSGEACRILDRLMVDREFYSTTANSYRDFAAKHYTFDAFNNNLNSILSSRGLT